MCSTHKQGCITGLDQSECSFAASQSVSSHQDRRTDGVEKKLRVTFQHLHRHLYKNNQNTTYCLKNYDQISNWASKPWHSGFRTLIWHSMFALQPSTERRRRRREGAHQWIEGGILIRLGSRRGEKEGDKKPREEKKREKRTSVLSSSSHPVTL